MCDMCGEWAPARAITRKGCQVILCSRCYGKVASAGESDIEFVTRTFGVEVGQPTYDVTLDPISPDFKGW